ncbi:MAG: hypothetical protein M3R07_03985 [Gemmatimonadota bacterium]|nr:hypothetical protein [Gemmatimonadota bacterium]
MGDGARRWAAIYSLRITALVVLISVAGAAWLPPVIRFFGRGGQRETVEWLVYVFLGTAFPVIAAVLAWHGPRIFPARVSRIAHGMLAGFLAVACIVFLTALGPAAFLLSVALAVLTLTCAGLLRQRRETDIATLAVSAVALTGVWASALTLASWTDHWAWATHSIRPMVVLAGLAAAAVATLPAREDGQEKTRQLSFSLSPRDTLPLLAFVVLSFRTTPIVEFYHWSFWTGPIESIRQGGWLLWDVPSQYGFLSLVTPALVPVADAWQALYLLQAMLYVAVAIAIYVVLKGLRPGVTASALAFAFTAAALFFRPRTSALILPAQMTPAGGPMRFVWCYAILAVLLWKYRRGDSVSPRRFAITGTLVWIASVAWSAESAIYCTSAWVGALGVFVLQRAFAGPVRTGGKVAGPSASTRDGDGVDHRGAVARQVVKHVAGALALLVGAVVAAVAVITAVYRAANGHGPDWASYYEYALLFSGGYSALPIDGNGAVWYLIVLFAAVSTAVVQFLSLDPRHPRLFVAVGAWGTIWAVSSYFVSRSHPVNLLSLVPLLVFALAIVLHLTRSLSSAYWVQLVRFAAVPLICVPPALTLSHAGFVPLLTERQTPMSELTAQVPAMDSSLAALAVRAGMKPSDPVFFTSDGRYLLPRWPELKDGIAETNKLAWMPKNYEMISTLPPERRDAYITRFSNRIGRGGWLVQKKSEINPGYESVVRLIEETFVPVESFENAEWVIRRYGIKAQPGR